MLGSRMLQAAAGRIIKLYIDDVFSAFTYTGNGSTQTITNGINIGDSKGTTDQQAFTTAGTYTWICPAGVTSVSVVAIGGGGYGGGRGGGGGELRYKNNITVTPGGSYTIVVGGGGSSDVVNGGQSSFATTSVTANGGISIGGTIGSAVAGGSGGTGDGGGNGGSGGSSTGGFAGGGGAGGYSGAGGNGAGDGAGTSTSGSGGGGGGGGNNADSGTGGGGGGVGILGAGSNGAEGAPQVGGGGGSGGATAGTRPAAGAYGGGGGGGGGGGAVGAIRIIWPGTARSFPSTNTGDVAPIGVVAGKGGMVWCKARSVGNHHRLFDTNRGVAKALYSSLTSAEGADSTELNAFNSNGFSLGLGDNINGNGATNIAWTFRKAPKFFDVVTWTGNQTNRTIAHSLGSVPGMIIIKSTTGTDAWIVYHKDLLATEYLVLNTTAAKDGGGSGMFNSTRPTATEFSLGGSGSTNRTGDSFVAYLFAHDASADGLIQCGTFTGLATVTLGWEPQFVLYKTSGSANSGWLMVDMSRGFTSGGPDSYVEANSSAAEVGNNDLLTPTATGFKNNLFAGDTFIYLAIRRPNKPPTLGTQVYNAIARTGTLAIAQITGVGFTPDLAWIMGRAPGWQAVKSFDRLRGANNTLYSNSTSAEVAVPSGDSLSSFNMDGVSLGPDSNNYDVNRSANYINHFFKRAPGVFDQVCYTGTGVARTVTHGLTVAPEIIIVKWRTNATANWQWHVYAAPLGADGYLTLNSTNPNGGPLSTIWNGTTPTSSVFSVGTSVGTNENNTTYVAYLFASKAGISKVGSYTGNGGSQTINCGFTTGARFVLIKRTSSDGDWYVWDSTRGIIAGNDPHLSLNTTAAEVTNDDSIDPDTTGFIVNQLAATNINVTSATYIFLAIA